MSVQTTLIDRSNIDYFTPLVPKYRTRSADLMLGAINESGKACGIFLARMGVQVLEHSYIYVSESDRRSGVEDALLNMAEDMARVIGFDGITFSMSEGDESPYHFQVSKILRQRGYSELKNQGTIYTFKLSDVSDRIATFRASSEVEIKPLKMAKSKDMEQLFAVTNQCKQTEFADELPYVYSYEQYDPDTSMLMISDDKVTGCLLISTADSRNILDYLFVAKEKSPFDVMALLYSGFKAASEKYGSDQVIIANAINEKMAKQICKFTDNKAVQVAKAVSYCLDL